MTTDTRPWRRLITSASLPILLILVLGMGSLSWLANRTTRNEMQALLGQQQLAMATLLASQVNEELSERLSALEKAAAGITSAQIGDPRTLQISSEHVGRLYTKFNGSVVVLGLDGTAMADVTLASGRIGVNLTEVESIATLLKEGRATIGRPVAGSKTFHMAVPIRDAQGQMMGALVGVTNLDTPNFLDKATVSPHGKTGTRFIAEPTRRLVITDTGRSHILQPLPGYGVSTELDRFLLGHEGTLVYVDHLGVQVLASFKRIPLAGWIMVVMLPADEAFAAVRATQRQMFLTAVLLTLLAGGLVGWLTRRKLRQQLAPLLTLARSLATQRASDQRSLPLAVIGHDEVDEVIGGFGRLLHIVDQVQGALGTSDARLRCIFDSTNVGIALIDSAGRITRFNDTFRAMLGFEAPALEGMRLADVTHADDLKVELAAFDSLLAGRLKHCHFTKRCVASGGRLLWFDTCVSAVRGATGEVLSFVIVMYDVTELRQVAVLQASGAFKQAILDSLDAAIAVLDKDGMIVNVNDAWLRSAWDCTVADCQAETGTEVGVSYFPATQARAAWLAGDALPPYAGVWEVLDGRRSGFTFECRCDSPQHERWFSTTVTPLVQTTMQGVVIARTDTSLIKQAELGMIQARDEANRANVAKSDFLASMSHELRTPMNAVLGFAQLIVYDAALSNGHKDNAREILKAGYHLLQLINEVLDLSKIESGQVAMSLEPVEVGAIVVESLHLVGGMAQVQGIALNQTGLSGVFVHADRTRLRQALLNLLSNAIKYNRTGGSVRVDVRPEGVDRLRIVVIDTGAGIPATRLVELFQPFKRLGNEGGGIEGAGIGLTITRRLVEIMGGCVGVESEEGLGSTFWIEFQRESRPMQESKESVVGAPPPVRRPCERPHAVLYIEDNPANLKLVAQILERRQDVRLLTADRPETGIRLAQAHRPALILLDINMPEMDGYEVLAVFKADAELATIPVVAVTANAMPRDIARGKAAGFADYLVKPLDLTLFHEVLDRLLAASDRS